MQWQDIAERIKRYTSSDPVPIYLTMVKPGEDAPFRVPLTRDSIFKKHEESGMVSTPRGGGGSNLDALKYNNNASSVITHLTIINTSSDAFLVPEDSSSNIMLPPPAALPSLLSSNASASFDRTQTPNQSTLDADDSVLYRAQNNSSDSGAYNRTMDLSALNNVHGNNNHNNNNNNAGLYGGGVVHTDIMRFPSGGSMSVHDGMHNNGNNNNNNSQTQNQSMYDPNDSVYKAAAGNISSNPALKTITVPHALTQTQTHTQNNNQSLYDPDDSVYTRAHDSIYKGNETIDAGISSRAQGTGGPRSSAAGGGGASYMQQETAHPASQLQQQQQQSTQNGFQPLYRDGNNMAPAAANFAPDDVRGDYPEAPSNNVYAPEHNYHEQQQLAAAAAQMNTMAMAPYAMMGGTAEGDSATSSSHIHASVAPMHTFPPSSHMHAALLPPQSPRQSEHLSYGGGAALGMAAASPQHHQNDHLDHSGANYSVAMSPNNATERSAYTPPLEESTLRSPRLDNSTSLLSNRPITSHIYSDYDAFSDSRNEMSPEPEIRAKSPIQRANVVDISVQFYDIPVDTPMRDRQHQSSVVGGMMVRGGGVEEEGYSSNNYNNSDNAVDVVVVDVPLQTSTTMSAGQNSMSSPPSEFGNKDAGSGSQMKSVEKGEDDDLCVCVLCVSVCEYVCMYVCK